ncbi:hypothetical protein [Nonomuraea sp. B5E05]|uniref:hypothetical protein n=1 Tax=Nonomuraea sp. B5E05 TaxID=3153569 RepID=UPI003261D064
MLDHPDRGRVEGGGDVGEVGRLRRALDAVRADLWTARADPLPRMSRPRGLSRLPHVLVILYALAMGLLPDGEGIDPTVPLLAMIHAAVLLLAMS